MKTVKQPSGSKLCGAACVAMVTGESLDDVLSRVTLSSEHGHLRTLDMVIALAQRGFLYGHNFVMRSAVEFEEFEQTVFSGADVLNIPAIVSVLSATYPGYYHWITYDPDIKMFRDPSRTVGDKANWDRYKFVDWTPILQVDEQ